MSVRRGRSCSGRTPGPSCPARSGRRPRRRQDDEPRSRVLRIRAAGSSKALRPAGPQRGSCRAPSSCSGASVSWGSRAPRSGVRRRGTSGAGRGGERTARRRLRSRGGFVQASEVFGSDLQASPVPVRRARSLRGGEVSAPRRTERREPAVRGGLSGPANRDGGEATSRAATAPARSGSPGSTRSSGRSSASRRSGCRSTRSAVRPPRPRPPRTPRAGTHRGPSPGPS